MASLQGALLISHNQVKQRAMKFQGRTTSGSDALPMNQNRTLKPCDVEADHGQAAWTSQHWQW